jgi:DNA invertase Pin-like site-specific DNA recombinase
MGNEWGNKIREAGTASGMVARPGFERLVAWLCAGEVGAVLCFDASRLARNGPADRMIGTGSGAILSS